MESLVQRFRRSKTENRIKILEEKAPKTPTRLRGTETQRFLTAFYLGQLDKIIEAPVTQKRKAVIVSVMLDIDPDNARKFLSEIPKREKPYLHKESNYIFLVDFFKECGLKDLQHEANRILISIQNAKDKKAAKSDS